MANLSAALHEFQLNDVNKGTWENLLKADATFSLDLGHDVDHITEETLKKLFKALTIADKDCWNVLREEQSRKLGTIDKLLCVLAQLCSHDVWDPRTPLAACCYLLLLMLPGSESNWNRVYRGIFLRRILKLILSTLMLPRSKEDAEAAPEANLNLNNYVKLLEYLQLTLEKHSISSQDDAISLDSIMYVMEDLTSLLGRPRDNAMLRTKILKSGFGCLQGLVANFKDKTLLCSYLFKLLMPQLLMTQNGHVANATKSLQYLKNVAIEFVGKLAADHPEVVNRESRPKSDWKAPEPDAPAPEGDINHEDAAARGSAEAGKDASKDADGNNVNEGNATGSDEGPKEGNAAEPKQQQQQQQKQPEFSHNKLDPLVGLCEHMCMSVPERQDWRDACASSVLTLLKPHQQCLDRYVQFLGKFLACEIPGKRVIASEVTIAILALEVDFWGLLSAVRDRTNDSAPTVRAKALLGIALAISRIPETEQALVFNPESEHFIDVKQIFLRRIQDTKSVVRKHTLSFFDIVAPFAIKANVDMEKIIHTVAALTADTSVSVRKTALASISLLVRRFPDDKMIFTAWADSVVPCVTDVEVTVADKALEDIRTVVFDPFIQAALRPELDLQAPIYQFVKGFDDETVEYLQRALTLFRKKHGDWPKKLKPALQKLVGDCLAHGQPGTWPSIAWSLLEEATSTDSNFVDWELIVSCYEYLRKEGREFDSLVAKTLTIVSMTYTNIEANRKKVITAELQEDLMQFNTPCFLTRTMMSTLSRVSPSSVYTIDMVKKIHNCILAFIDHSRPNTVCEDMLERYLFTLGEICLIDHTRIHSSMIAALRCLGTGHVYKSHDEPRQLPAALRAHAFAALGKLCLRREDLAKRSIELFVLHIRQGEHPAVRNAILIILCDLAMKYTSLVDRFIPHMANMLRDGNVLLRKQAAMIISSLLSEEFIKFKGQMMIRILYAIADPVPEIKELIESVFVRILIPRNPAIFSNYFVDHICSMNNWRVIPKFDKEPVGETFSLQKNPRKRCMIYRFMLSTLANDQKFTLAQHIVKDICGAFVNANDQKQPIPKDPQEPAYSALCDALALLGSKEMKVCFFKDGVDPEDEDAEGMAELQAAAGAAAPGGAGGANGGAAGAPPAAAGGAVDNKARAKILGLVMKRNLTEILIPMLLELRAVVVACCSTLIKNVDMCIKEVLVDYRSDMESVIRKEDSLLIKEIEFDMKEQARVVIKERPSLMESLEGRTLLEGIRPPGSGGTSNLMFASKNAKSFSSENDDGNHSPALRKGTDDRIKKMGPPAGKNDEEKGKDKETSIQSKEKDDGSGGGGNAAAATVVDTESEVVDKCARISASEEGNEVDAKKEEGREKEKEDDNNGVEPMDVDSPCIKKGKKERKRGPQSEGRKADSPPPRKRLFEGDQEVKEEE